MGYLERVVRIQSRIAVSRCGRTWIENQDTVLLIDELRPRSCLTGDRIGIIEIFIDIGLDIHSTVLNNEIVCAGSATIVECIGQTLDIQDFISAGICSKCGSSGRLAELHQLVINTRKVAIQGIWLHLVVRSLDDNLRDRCAGRQGEFQYHILIMPVQDEVG